MGTTKRVNLSSLGIWSDDYIISLHDVIGNIADLQQKWESTTWSCEKGAQ